MDQRQLRPQDSLTSLMNEMVKKEPTPNENKYKIDNKGGPQPHEVDDVYGQRMNIKSGKTQNEQML